MENYKAKENSQHHAAVIQNMKDSAANRNKAHTKISADFADKSKLISSGSAFIKNPNVKCNLII